jgi:hypothetical protein
MGTSVVSICNMALGKIGAQSITAITEASENARACNRFYEACRDELLRRHPWNFAINRATLAQLADPPAYGYDHAYQLPSSPYCLRVLELYEERDSGYDFLIEGRKLITDSDTARIKYIQQVTDPAQFDSTFVEALATRLAAEIAIPVTGESGIAEALIKLAEMKAFEAIGNDGLEGHADEDDKPVEVYGAWLSER